MVDRDIEKAKEFRNELIARGLDARSFCILGEREESLCMVNSEAKWKVYFLERGHRSNLEDYADFESAKSYFLRRLIEIYPQASVMLLKPK